MCPLCHGRALVAAIHVLPSRMQESRGWPACAGHDTGESGSTLAGIIPGSEKIDRCAPCVMAALVAAIHVFPSRIQERRGWPAFAGHDTGESGSTLAGMRPSQYRSRQDRPVLLCATRRLLRRADKIQPCRAYRLAAPATTSTCPCRIDEPILPAEGNA